MIVKKLPIILNEIRFVHPNTYDIYIKYIFYL